MKVKSEFLFERDGFPIRVLPCRSSLTSLRDERSSAIHEAVEIKLFYEGSSRLVIDNGETFRAECGDVILVNPYEFHTTLDCSEENDGKYHLIMIGLDFFDGLGERGLDLKELFFAKQIRFKNLFKKDVRLAGLLNEIVTEWESRGEAYKLAIFGLVSELFAYLLREGVDPSRTSADKPVVKYYRVIEPALSVIRDSYSRKITVDELAALCYVSKYHFCRIFKLCTGLTPIQYLNKHRLKIAEELLLLQSMRISDVAIAAGFESVSYFCKIYKKHFGVSPKGHADGARS